MTSHVVVGGGGFLGRHLAKVLDASGEDVSIVDVAPYPGESTSVKSLLVDLSRASDEDFDTVVGNADVVHHCAWTTIPATANVHPLTDLQDNLKITIGLLDALKRRRGGRIIFSSSGGTVYGRLLTTPVPEDHPLDPITAYGVSKVAAEKYLHLYRYLHGVDGCVLRISNLYGTGQNPLRQQGVVTTWVHRALADQGIEIWGDGEIVRDFIHIADVVAAFIAAAAAASSPTDSLPVFNIGSGTGHSLNDVVHLIEDEIGIPIAVERKPTRPFDVRSSVLDISKAMRDLNWRPRISLRTGVAGMIRDLTSDRTRLFSAFEFNPRQGA